MVTRFYCVISRQCTPYNVPRWLIVTNIKSAPVGGALLATDRAQRWGPKHLGGSTQRLLQPLSPNPHLLLHSGLPVTTQGNYSACCYEEQSTQRVMLQPMTCTQWGSTTCVVCGDTIVVTCNALVAWHVLDTCSSQ